MAEHSYPMDGGALKTPLQQTLAKAIAAGAQDKVQALGYGMPVTVTAIRSPWIVTVTPAADTTPWTIQPIELPVAVPPYIALPIQIGDAGVMIPVGVRLGGLSGLGAGTPKLTDVVGNLATHVFMWLGKTSYVTPDPQAVCLLEPTGNCQLLAGPTGVKIQGANGNLDVTGNVTAGNGWSGTFTTPTGQVVTVVAGIITNCA
jgi:hypothetical protein